ncbi:MAG: phenylalanine--tRNA ligase subunit beta, partial [Acidimicrobiales bacterium]
MKVLLSWLRDFAPFEGDPVALGEEMSDLGMAVEDIERIGEGLDAIVVARVLETRPIEGANKIHLVIVDAGDGEPLEIGCGAFNMSAGDLVPLATIGTVLPNGMEIGRRKMAGVWSNGMLCSTQELGLGDDHEGIYLLPAGVEAGTAFTEAMGIEADVLYDLEINPNRPDAMSVAGVARDLAARLRLPFTLPDPMPATVPADRVSAVTVEILDPDRCGRFEARVLRDVTVGPGDPKLACRLALLGMRSINNVVDVSNYVMLELGQPNHPYDLSKVAGPGFRVRVARDGEVLTTLDDVERRLTAEDLLICDGHDVPVGLGGIMGGAASEIDDGTSDVLLEMAWFHPIGIVKSSRRHKLRSEASARFEKGCDPEVVDLAMRRFAELLGATLEDGVAVAIGALPERPRARVRTARTARLLGTELSTDRIAELLDPIGFTTTPAGDDLDVDIPSWRYDCETEIDVIEEIARHHGYTALGRTRPRAAHAGSLSPRQAERRRLRALLVGRGLTEAMPMP